MIGPAYEAGRTVRRTVHARPATGAVRFPLRDTWTGPAADAEQANSAESTTAPAKRFMWIQTLAAACGLQTEGPSDPGPSSAFEAR
jgi:hypothetical protein